jgi:hypothetical protein
MNGDSNTHLCSTCRLVYKPGKEPLCDPTKQDIWYPQMGPTMVCSGYERETLPQTVEE